MRLLAQEEYGLRCLLRVARDANGSTAKLSEVAKAEGLSEEYAGKLMQVLRRAGLVTSVRGPGGGYRLCRPPSEITVWEAVDALGGPLFPKDFCECHAGQEADCVRAGDCALRALWRGVDRSIREFLERVKLADLWREEEPMAEWLGLAEVNGGR